MLEGGGELRIVNRAVPLALRRLSYCDRQIADVVSHLNLSETLAGPRHLAERDLPVFDCALPAAGSARCVSPGGHLSVVAAIQPFVSGSVAKTVKLPAAAAVGQVAEVFLLAWRLGLKAIAVYCQGSKRLEALRATPAPAGGAGVGPLLNGTEGTVGPASLAPSSSYESGADRPNR